MSEFGYTGNISSGAGTFDNFKSNNVVNGTKEFLESNSLVAKIAFLLLVLIVFVIAVALFIVIYYTIYHIVLSIKMMKRFLNVSKTVESYITN